MRRRAAKYQADDIVDTAIIARLLDCSEQTAEEIMRSGDVNGIKLQATKIGRGWVTTYAHVVAYLHARIKAPSTPPGEHGPPIAGQALGIKAVIVQQAPKGPRGRRQLPDLSGLNKLAPQGTA